MKSTSEDISVVITFRALISISAGGGYSALSYFPEHACLTHIQDLKR